jgi:hypothetical protein
VISKLNESLKQIAIEEGQWTEKRENSPTVSIDVFRARLNAGRQRVVDAKKAALAKGEKWP